MTASQNDIREELSRENSDSHTGGLLLILVHCCFDGGMSLAIK